MFVSQNSELRYTRKQGIRMSLRGYQISHYQLLHEIGSGGTSKVYLAQDQNIQARQVAIKVINLESEADATQRAWVVRRFLREVKAISQLNHPHILPLYDYGEVE